MSSMPSLISPRSAFFRPLNQATFNDTADFIEFRPFLQHSTCPDTRQNSSTCTSPQSEKAKDFEYNQIYLPKKQWWSRVGVHSFTSWASLRLLCYVLHGLLVIIHAVLLVLYFQGVDQRIVIPFEKMNIYSGVLIVSQQGFFTIYQGGLVVLTQKLALRSNLLRRQTLTALHNQSLAWEGLGASVMSLWRQGKLPTAVFGTLSVALYLIFISVLHVTSSSLLDVESYNSTYLAVSTTNLAMPNMTAVMETLGEESWAEVSTVASTIGQFPLVLKHGFSSNTVYDTLSDTTGTGNVTYLPWTTL